jgi:DUF4097 and DUF4098 domain-containing protein YvlB
MSYHRHTALAGFLGILAMGTGCFMDEVAHAARDHFERDVAFEPGGTFRLENVNGSVVIETWDQAQIRIEADKRAPSERLLEEIEIDVEQVGDLVEVKTRLPRRFLGFGQPGKVDYRIRLPRHVRADVETVNGKLEVEGVRGRLQASTVNGSVALRDVGGEVEASTVNGSIEAHYAEVASDGAHRFSTTNGGVRLYLPPDVGGAFEARTVNGSIETDFPLEVKGRVGKRLEGRLGEGRGSFRVTTVNGSVRLIRS